MLTFIMVLGTFLVFALEVYFQREKRTRGEEAFFMIFFYIAVLLSGLQLLVDIT